MALIDLSLERLSFQFSLPPTLHVAGTNGKGSTLAFIKSILEQAGYSVHRYTSPYFWKQNECIELNSKPVEDEKLYNALKKFENTNLTPFEKQTMAAFDLFSQTKADFLLLETGLGGRLDATNIIKDPFLTAITSVSYDHTEFLGSTLEEIAYEKAGIIKENRPCFVSSCIPEKAMRVIEKIALSKNAPLHFAPPYSGKIGLAGDHQRYNAGLAASCLQSFISSKNIQKGIEKTKWIGRMQTIFYQGRHILVDGAHNEEGARALCQNLPNNVHAIVAIKSTKDYKAILDKLKQNIAHFSYVPLEDGHPPSILQNYLPGKQEDSLEPAISSIPEEFFIVITGSLKLIELIDKKYFETY